MRVSRHLPAWPRVFFGKAGKECVASVLDVRIAEPEGLHFIFLIAIIVKYRGTKKDKERSEKISKENFMTVQAKYVETIINSDVTVFGTHPYNIICEWKNPVDKKRYRFVSEDLWRSPQRKILEKSILSFEVNFDKTDVNNYKIIIPEILK